MLCSPTGLVIQVLTPSNVARSIGRLLDRGCSVKPRPLVKDGDLVALVQSVIQARGRDTVRVTKAKGHATDEDVEHGRMRLADKVGNAEAEADAAADLGRRHQSELLMDARQRLLNVRSHWYPFMLQLHRFVIAVARVTVNGRKKTRRMDIRLNVDLASFTWSSQSSYFFFPLVLCQRELKFDMVVS